MSVSNHILNLKRKYVQLNNLIQDELSRPLPNSLVLFDLKLRRLRLKEMIAELVQFVLGGYTLNSIPATPDQEEVGGILSTL